MDDSVSVVIPYYNDSPRIEKCLDSICSQTRQAIEVIIVDDCSKDSALLLKIIDKFKNKINIRYLRNDENKNGAYSRNVGMREARGGIVAFLDADDYWATDHLEESVNALLLNGVEFVFSNVIEVDCCGCESRRKVTNPQYLDNKYDIILLSPPQTNSFLFRKKIFDTKEIFFDENLRRHQDYQFLTLILEKNISYQYIDKYTSYYVQSHRPHTERMDYKSVFLFWEKYNSYVSGRLLKKFITGLVLEVVLVYGKNKAKSFIDSHELVKINASKLFLYLVLKTNFGVNANRVIYPFFIIFYSAPKAS